MNSSDYSKLDNPAWHSLNETHQLFAIGNDEIKFYKTEICPFGGINSKHPDLVSFFKKYTQLNSLFIIGDKPQELADLIIENELICLQMICPASIKMEFTETIILLGKTHKKQLTDLVNLVQPGYFKEGTALMGDYYGIYKNNRLVAVTGERMKMFGFTEISAVVTHLDFTGKGFAKQLVAHTANKNFDHHKIPYLHVAESNTNAIKLYEKLGFVSRRKISFWKMKRRV
ncbi:MAG TPA: GNAT family N-acetyltransferase [Chitinophagaceae bacterium]|nr:GNAT family N-acetyltransferase [Chitinophagaceae bacterium]